MDYLDPKKQTRQNALLLVGYFLIGIAILIGTFVLVYQAYGFGFSKNGQVVQSGLVFFSSKPNPAKIYLNGTLSKNETNSRIVLEENIYDVVLKRQGYRDWKRTIEVDGGSVRHYDYPFLFPVNLQSSNLHAIAGAPNIITQSPDKRWLLIQLPSSIPKFLVYDLKNPKDPAVEIALPANSYTKAIGAESWEFSEWADDNNHLVLIHNFNNKREYVLVDRKDPAQSVNLSNTITEKFTELSLINKKYDKYYLYDPVSFNLKKASLSSPTPIILLSKAYAFKSYGNDDLLYVTDSVTEPGKIQYVLKIGDKSYVLKNAASDSKYLVDLTEYSNKLYVVIGSANNNRLYVFKDPVAQLSSTNKNALAPVQVLHVVKPNYVKFSASAQFVMAENGNQFALYDAENNKGYNFTTKQPLDAPQQHASWMDGNRLMYVSQGKLFVFDYDYNNQQLLSPALSNYMPVFSSDYKYLYAVVNTSNAGLYLSQTSMLTKADQ